MQLVRIDTRKLICKFSIFICSTHSYRIPHFDPYQRNSGCKLIEVRQIEPLKRFKVEAFTSFHFLFAFSFALALALASYNINLLSKQDSSMPSNPLSAHIGHSPTVTRSQIHFKTTSATTNEVHLVAVCLNNLHSSQVLSLVFQEQVCPSPPLSINFQKFDILLVNRQGNPSLTKDTERSDKCVRILLIVSPFAQQLQPNQCLLTAVNEYFHQTPALSQLMSQLQTKLCNLLVSNQPNLLFILNPITAQ